MFWKRPDGRGKFAQTFSLDLDARGITTGDKNSYNFARAALYKLLEVAHPIYTVVQTREWVDDLVQRIIGPVSRIQHHLEKTGLFVFRGLREAGFTVSPKTTLVTTDRSFSTRLVQKYQTSGFPVHSAMSAADLNILHQRISHIPQARRWRRVGGHLAAVITTLLDAGWNLHTATCWEDPDGNE